MSSRRSVRPRADEAIEQLVVRLDERRPLRPGGVCRHPVRLAHRGRVGERVDRRRDSAGRLGVGAPDGPFDLGLRARRHLAAPADHDGPAFDSRRSPARPRPWGTRRTSGAGTRPAPGSRTRRAARRSPRGRTGRARAGDSRAPRRCRPTSTPSVSSIDRLTACSVKLAMIRRSASPAPTSRWRVIASDWRASARPARILSAGSRRSSGLVSWIVPRNPSPEVAPQHGRPEAVDAQDRAREDPRLAGIQPEAARVGMDVAERIA